MLGLFGQHGARDWRQRPADLPETRYMKKLIGLNACHHGFSFADVEARHKPHPKGIPKKYGPRMMDYYTIFRLAYCFFIAQGLYKYNKKLSY